MTLAFANMPSDKFMVATTCGQRLSHGQQPDNFIQFRHVQAAPHSELVGAFELCGSGDEVHGHCVRSSSPQGGLLPR